MKTTPWFPPSVKPARPGWYQRRIPGCKLLYLPDYFDGRDWYFGGGDQPVKLVRRAEWRDRSNVWEWRGLTEPQS